MYSGDSKCIEDFNFIFMDVSSSRDILKLQVGNALTILAVCPTNIS